MADRTLTASPAISGANQNAEVLHAGNVTIPFSYSANGATNSVSDVIFLAKIPAGAIIYDMNFWLYSGNATATTVDIGMDGDASADVFVDGHSISQTGATVAATIRAGSTPYFCSISDNAAQRFRYLQAKIASGDPSQTFVVKGYVSYKNGRSSLT